MGGPWEDYAPADGPWNDYKPAAKPKPKSSTGKDVLRAISQGVSLGFSDEFAGLEAGSRQLGENLRNRLAGRPIERTAANAFSETVSQEREEQRRYASEHPIQNAFAQIGGGLLTPGAGLIGNALARGATVGRAAATGGAYGAAAGAGYAEGGVANRAKGAASGALVGAGAGGALQASANALVRSAAAARARPPSPQRQLSQQGVDLTPGQMAGGALQRMEDGLTSVPILGDAIRGARIRGIESFDRAALNRTMAPVGGQLTPNANVGREGVRTATQTISGAYDNALQGVTVTPDQPYIADLQQVAATPNLTAAQREQLNVVLGDINTRLNGPVPGDLWKVIDSDIGKAIRAADHASAQQPGGRALTEALRRLQTAHNDLLQRTSQHAHDGVQAADAATANLARVRQASQYVGTSARDGLFSPADLNRAVQGMDTSAGNRAFAQGDALMQDLTDPAMQVLPQQVPDSGTPFRSLLQVGGITGGGVALGANPVAVGAGVAGLAAGAGVYSRPVQAAINAAFRASTPGQAREALAALQRLAARDPALVPVYQEVARRLGVPLPHGDGQQATQR